MDAKVDTLHPEYVRACDDMIKFHLSTSVMAERIADILTAKHGPDHWRVHRSRNVASSHDEAARYIQVHILKMVDA